MRAVRRLLPLVVLSGAAAVASAVAFGAVFGSAIQVPGTQILNSAGAEVSSVSCPKARYCAAGGEYVDSAGDEQAFVVDEQNGAWQDAIEVPGSQALNVDGDARLFQISCPKAGACAVAGFYRDGDSDGHGFLANETNGVWGNAMNVPGVPAFSGGFSVVSAISCAKAGFCTAGGSYEDSHGNSHAFVVTETNGVWSKAVSIAKRGELSSISCPTAESCAAGGTYDGACPCQAWVATAKNGVWGKAEIVPGLKAFNNGLTALAVVNSVSCPAAGSCAAAGYYTGGHDLEHSFVADEKNGVWGKAIKVSGAAALGPGEVLSISCAAAGSCAAGGYYGDSSHREHAFVVSEKRGVWLKATKVDNLGAVGEVYSVSCVKPGFCAAGGLYVDGPAGKPFVVNQRNGVWHDATDVPGMAALDLGPGSGASVWSIDCPDIGSCMAGGSYRDETGVLQAFVTQP